MIIDKYFNPQKNTYLVASYIIQYLMKEKEVNIDDLILNVEQIYPNVFDNYLFEAFGLLYLTDKIFYEKEKNIIGLKICD